MVFLEFPTIFGSIMICESLLPISPNLQRAQNQVWADRFVPRFVAKFLLSGLVAQFERDITIWTNKRWIRKPMAIKEDGPLLKFRRYCKQFYSEQGTRVREGAFDW